MLLTLIKKEILEQAKTRKLLVIFFVLLIFALMSPITAKETPQILKNFSTPGITITIVEPTFRDAVDQFMKNNSQLVVFIFLFVVAGSVVEEKVKRTLEITLTKPLTRTNFILAKYLSYFLTISAAFILSSVVFYLYTWSIFTSFSFWNFTIMSLMALLYVLVIVTATIFGSTIAKNNLLAAGTGFLSLIVFGLLGIAPKLSKYLPTYIFSKYQLVLTDGWNKDLSYSIITAAIVILILIVSSVLIFQKQEVER